MSLKAIEVVRCISTCEGLENITQSQIALIVDCSERKVKRIMKDMTEKGIIEHVRGRQMGKWVILKRQLRNNV